MFWPFFAFFFKNITIWPFFAFDFKIFAMMKTKFFLILLACSLLLACSSTKTGCPSDNAKVKVDKNGMPTQKSKSNLFSKSMRKRMGN